MRTAYAREERDGCYTFGDAIWLLFTTLPNLKDATPITCGTVYPRPRGPGDVGRRGPCAGTAFPDPAGPGKPAMPPRGAWEMALLGWRWGGFRGGGRGRGWGGIR